MNSIQFSHSHKPSFGPSHDPARIGKIVAMTVAGIFGAIFLGFLLGWLIKFLWNETIVPTFAAAPISYWQAVGLFILAKFFFGFGNSGHRSRHKHKRTEEEKIQDQQKRNQWKHWMRAKYAHGSSSAEDTTLQQYWEQEGKAAYEAFLATRAANPKNPPEDSGTSST